jgi:hypothetical protein
MGWTTKESCFDSWPGKEIFLFFSSPSLLCYGYWGLFLQGQSSWGVKVTIHFI